MNSSKAWMAVLMIGVTGCAEPAATKAPPAETLSAQLNLDFASAGRRGHFSLAERRRPLVLAV